MSAIGAAIVALSAVGLLFAAVVFGVVMLLRKKLDEESSTSRKAGTNGPFEHTARNASQASSVLADMLKRAKEVSASRGLATDESASRTETGIRLGSVSKVRFRVRNRAGVGARFLQDLRSLGLQVFSINSLSESDVNSEVLVFAQGERLGRLQAHMEKIEELGAKLVDEPSAAFVLSGPPTLDLSVEVHDVLGNLGINITDSVITVHAAISTLILCVAPRDYKRTSVALNQIASDAHLDVTAMEDREVASYAAMVDAGTRGLDARAASAG